jgi:predicted ATPase
MLTRLEVDGFKNLLGLHVDFSPFTCIVGENGAGKSNVFDAIHFLSLLADHPMMDAAQQVRQAGSERAGDPRDLFWNGFADESRRMSFAAEMIVPAAVEDDFGQPAKPTISFLRYELAIGYVPPSGLERIGRLALLSERLTHINQSDAAARLRFPHSAKSFRRSVVFGRRSGAFISTSYIDFATSEFGEPIIILDQDVGDRGQPRLQAHADRAPATVVSTVTSSDFPTVLAARREMQSWRVLALEPSELRTSDRYDDPREMNTRGRYLAAALHRITTTAQTAGGGAERVYARVANRLSELAELRVREVEVAADDVRELLTVYLTDSAGMRLPARSLSEGTLRFLALCVLLEDPSATGVVCMEEPENGIHPANIPAVVRLAEDLAVDPRFPTGEDNPFRQVIINTHSPVVVQLVDPNDLLFAAMGPHKAPDSSIVRALRLSPLAGTWRSATGEGDSVSKADLLPYLTAPAEARLRLRTFLVGGGVGETKAQVTGSRWAE